MATSFEDLRDEYRYEGLFGALCKHVPIFDARAPDGWIITSRRWDGTVWKHPETGVDVRCEKDSGGWNVCVVDHRESAIYHTLPRDTSRFKAYDAARQFLEGEDPLLVDRESEHGDEWKGPLTLEAIREARQ